MVNKKDNKEAPEDGSADDDLLVTSSEDELSTITSNESSFGSEETYLSDSSEDEADHNLQ